ncbi:PGF-CTERM sorting domain-containing protein [Halorussus caseinilyticus]|uniref:PGF-CTERM sorting domain-containing protein n=1 Tax=Halorussus caseinilyticus TaxID=3034025 RepID=A0ABD5WM80_9EURY
MTEVAGTSTTEPTTTRTTRATTTVSSGDATATTRATTDDGSGSVPGFGPVVALVALAITFAAASRRT